MRSNLVSLRKESITRMLITLLVVVVLVVFAGCTQKEPSLPPSPKDMGVVTEKYLYNTTLEYPQSLLKVYQIPSRCIAVGADGKPVRIADLKVIDWEAMVLIYSIQYPPYGITSVAKFRLGPTRSILEETFPEKWLIQYEYTEKHPEKYGIPGSYSVFAYSPETKTYDRLLDKFTLLQIEWGGRGLFRNIAGKVIERDILYFIVVPEQR